MNHTLSASNWVARLPVKIIVFFFVFGVAAMVACKPSTSADSFTISTATPSLHPTDGLPTSTPEPPVPYPISGIPHCPGLQDLGYVLEFDWPDIETALEKLEDYNWGYYSCLLSQPELKAFYREKMPKPPYLWQEVAWVEHGDSTGALFYHSVFRSWIYIWMLPQAGSQNSHLVIAKGDPGMPQTWDCWLWHPNNLAFACPPCQRSIP
jgi:hypothetical protein